MTWKSIRYNKPIDNSDIRDHVIKTELLQIDQNTFEPIKALSNIKFTNTSLNDELMIIRPEVQQRVTDLASGYYLLSILDSYYTVPLTMSYLIEVINTATANLDTKITPSCSGRI